MSWTRTEILDRLEHMENMPAISGSVTRLLEALQDPQSHAAYIEQILMYEPVLSSKLLNVVNSALFAIPGTPPITSLRQAITRLGFNEIRNIVLSCAIVDLLEKIPERLFNRFEFIRHCIATSLLAVEIGKNLPSHYGLKLETLHLAALVHDLGKIFLDSYFPGALEEVIQLSIQHHLPLIESEKIVIEITHSDIGYLIASQWDLPEFAKIVIQFHHQPKYVSPEYRNLTVIINVANYLSNTCDLGNGGDFTAPSFSRELWNFPELPLHQIPYYLPKIRQELQSIMDLFV